MPRIGPGGQRENDHSGARGQSDVEHCAVFDRVNKGKNEESRDDKMTEAESIGPVAKKGKSRVSLLDS